MSDLALFWAGVIAVAILVYVVLDGFDLGVGVLSGFARDDAERSRMFAAIAPYWDGNETWLVVVGAGLYAAFPQVYAVFLGAFYIPVLLLLFGLIFRGIAFEFREHARRARRGWDLGFFLGSVAAAFVQGAAVGAMMRGLPVENGQFAGTAFDWVAPFPLLTGAGLVLGYALLGAAWLMLKTDGELRLRAQRQLPWLAAAMLAVLALAFTVTLDLSTLAAGHWTERRWGLGFVAAGLVALGLSAWAAQRGRDFAPFGFAVLFFLCAFATLGTMFWPYMVPYSVTVADAAAPEASLSFLFWGAGIFVPAATAIYTAAVYWIFRGKSRGGY